MAKENILKFFDRARNDEALRKKVDALESADPSSLEEELARLSRDVGTPFTPEELKDAVRNAHGEIPDEELDPVAGGRGLLTHARRDPDSSSFTDSIAGFFRNIFG